MPKLVQLLFLLSINYCCYAQVSDMITVRKKNGQTIKSFVAGSPIVFETTYGTFVDGVIKDLRNDSLFVPYYDIRTYVTNFGGRATDTFGVYMIGVHYSEILRIKVFQRYRLIRGNIGALSMIGGGGYAALNIINSLYLKESITESKNLRRLGIASGIAVSGFLIQKFFPVNRFSRKRHQIRYVKLKQEKQNL